MGSSQTVKKFYLKSEREANRHQQRAPLSLRNTFKPSLPLETAFGALGERAAAAAESDL